MVDIVAAFPPAQTQPSNEVCDDNTDTGISLEVVRDTHVTGIMGREYKLVPETAEEQASESKA